MTGTSGYEVRSRAAAPRAQRQALQRPASGVRRQTPRVPRPAGPEQPCPQLALRQTAERGYACGAAKRRLSGSTLGEGMLICDDNVGGQVPR